jgi:hypothetical protein
MKCKNCGNEIKGEWRRDSYTIRHVPLMFCSRNCNNSRIRTPEIKEKISKTLTGRIRPEKRVPKIEKSCQVCGDNFKCYRWQNRKVCSNKICSNYLNSICRQKYIAKNGTFSTLRETFIHKDITIDVDSNLEKAGIIYLLDVLGAKRIERYKNLINYWEKEARRTFNPDFICEINSITHLVEVKQKWIKTSDHSYNRTIPYKKEALKNFCKDKGYKMLWLDFDSAPKMKEIYKQIMSRSFNG